MITAHIMKVYSELTCIHELILNRDVKVSSRDHFFGLGLGLTAIGLGLGLGLMR